MLSVESMFSLLKRMNLWSDVGPEYVYKTSWKVTISLFRKRKRKLKERRSNRKLLHRSVLFPCAVFNEFQQLIYRKRQ